MMIVIHLYNTSFLTLNYTLGVALRLRIKVTYPQEHVSEAKRPKFLDAEKLTAEYVILNGPKALNYPKEKLKKERPNTPTPDYIITESILKASEPYIAEIIQRLPGEDIQEIFAKYGSLIVTSLYGTIPEIGNRIKEAMKPKNGKPAQVQIIKGQIESMVKSEDNKHFVIPVRTSNEEEPTIINASVVIPSLGPQHDYEKVNSPLWKRLIDVHKTATPHKTKRGVEVGEHGELRNPDGKESTIVYIVGTPCQGAQLLKIGEWGLNIGTIRNQALDRAVTVLDRLTSKYQGLPDLKLNADSKNIAKLINEEVLRITGRQPGDKQSQAIEKMVSRSLSEKFIKSQKEILASRNPFKKKEFDKTVSGIEEIFIKDLKDAGIDTPLSRNIVVEASRQRVRIAVRELTDGKKQYVIYDRNSQSNNSRNLACKAKL